MANQAVTETQIPGIPVRHGKVRDVYDFGDKLLLVATDRISAFDWILPTGIPDKGRILTQLSKFWFELLGVENHLISLDPQELPLPAGTDVESLQGRSMVVKKSVVVPIECVARGYLAGSGWKEYQQNQSVCGIKLPQGLVNGSRIPDTIFTPATKAEEGHDENISFEVMCEAVDNDLAVELQQRTLNIYQRAADYALTKGIIIADTKFEFGQINEEVILIDEVLTPDSSRFWPVDEYRPGLNQPSFDKQFVREWLESTPWDKNSPPPELPEEIVEQTRSKYIDAYELLTEKKFV
jgi:phosphoribosylaminoimidazole-succinocarboxamide synthase